MSVQILKNRKQVAKTQCLTIAVVVAKSEPPNGNQRSRRKLRKMACGINRHGNGSNSQWQTAASSTTVNGGNAGPNSTPVSGCLSATRMVTKGLVCVCVFFQHSFSAEKSCARLNMPKAFCWPPSTEVLVKDPPNIPEQALDAQKLRSKEEEKQQLALEATAWVKRCSAKFCRLTAVPCK